MTCHDEYDLVPTGPVTVAGIDFSPSSAAALRWAVVKAARECGRVRAVHAFRAEPVPSGPGLDAVDRPAVAAWQRSEVEEHLADFVREAAADLTVEAPIDVVALEGAAPQVLLSCAAEADTLVLGVPHEPSAVSRSTVAACAATPTCPVMVVPASWTPVGVPVPA